METPKRGDVIWVRTGDDLLEGLFVGIDTFYGTPYWKVRLAYGLRSFKPKECTVIKGQHAEAIKQRLVKSEQQCAEQHTFGWCHFVGTTGSPSCKQLTYSV